MSGLTANGVSHPALRATFSPSGAKDLRCGALAPRSGERVAEGRVGSDCVYDASASRVAT